MNAILVTTHGDFSEGILNLIIITKYRIRTTVWKTERICLRKDTL